MGVVTQATISSILNWTELPNSPREILTPDGSEIVRDLMVANSSRFELAQAFWMNGNNGVPDKYGMTLPAWLTWTTSKTYTTFWVASIEMTKFSASKGGGAPSAGPIHIPAASQGALDPEYDFCKMTVRYSMRQPVISERLAPAGKYIPIPTKGLYWYTSSKPVIPIDEQPEDLEPIFDWFYEIRGIKWLPPEVFTLLGQCNSAKITTGTIKQQDDSATFTAVAFDAETVKYDAPFLEPCYIPMAQTWKSHRALPTWNLALRFKVKPSGWNKFRNGTDRTYDNLKTGVAGAIFKPVTPADLTPLLVAPSD